MLIWTSQDIAAWMHFSGDINPLHVDDRVAKQAGFAGPIVPGMLLSLTLLHQGFEQHATGKIQLFFKRPAIVGLPYYLRHEANSMRLYPNLDRLPVVTACISSAQMHVPLTSQHRMEWNSEALLHEAINGYPVALRVAALLFKQVLQHLKSMQFGTQSGQTLLATGKLFHLSNTMTMIRPVSEISALHFSFVRENTTPPGWLSIYYCHAVMEDDSILFQHTFGVRA